ncbi:hypothetical protein SISNIDRAFT_109080 [Sistotremastrum niveocremeum HHB9708]|uniref:Uncharacterized protein n=1 Tax=Sistotremastrum niveocremeum HHB9708 TaxID=1314777 RepID=A0A164TZY1_9AGAM|nr:hypothetical protein SISNIDRAFT_109080 [Sistotremastrum niveocremeum HHB9708]
MRVRNPMILRVLSRRRFGSGEQPERSHVRASRVLNVLKILGATSQFFYATLALRWMMHTIYLRIVCAGLGARSSWCSPVCELVSSLETADGCFPVRSKLHVGNILQATMKNGVLHRKPSFQLPISPFCLSGCIMIDLD